jgi:hypothetical protein
MQSITDHFKFIQIIMVLAVRESKASYPQQFGTWNIYATTAGSSFFENMVLPTIGEPETCRSQEHGTSAAGNDSKKCKREHGDWM